MKKIFGRRRSGKTTITVLEASVYDAILVCNIPDYRETLAEGLKVKCPELMSYDTFLGKKDLNGRKVIIDDVCQLFLSKGLQIAEKGINSAMRTLETEKNCVIVTVVMCEDC
jgi:hypothetical protein